MADIHPWQLETPAKDGGILLWPDPGRWAELAEQAAERFAPRGGGEPRLIDTPLSVARRAARASAAVFARAAPDPDRPWIVTGHQTFPYHPGVWAKNAAVDATARRLGAAAVNLNVDHDLPRAGFQLTWPAMDETGRLIRRGGLPLDHDRPFERQPAPSTDDLRRVGRQIDQDLAPLLAEPRSRSLELASDTAVPAADTFGGWFADARAQLDCRLGLQLAEAMTSRLAEQDSFLLFAADAIARCDQMQAAYNASVAQAGRLTGHDPAPELRTEEDRVELAFWSLRPHAPGRYHLFAAVRGGLVRLSDDQGAIGELAVEALHRADTAVDALRRALTDAGVALRPRALTLTLFTRLLLADVFIHGTGGALYDTATDLLFERFYGLPAPPYAVASATLWLGVDAATATADPLRRARRQLRDLRFNPQRHLPPPERSREPAAGLIGAKWAAVERNHALRGAVTDGSAAHRFERAELFARIRRLNDELVALMDQDLARQQEIVRQLSRQQQAGEVALARDYFYGLFPTDRLRELRDTIRQALE